MPVGQCSCWGAGCAQCVRLSYEWQTAGDSSDDDDSDSGNESHSRVVANAAHHAAACAAVCSACGGAGCSACVRLSCGWEESMHGHLHAARAVRTSCQCWGVGCSSCVGSMPSGHMPVGRTAPVDAALALLADGDDSDDGDVQQHEDEARVLPAGMCACPPCGAGCSSCQIGRTHDDIGLPHEDDGELYEPGTHPNDDSVDALAG